MQRLSADLALGGRYRLHEKIARGGMGEVWSAHDELLNRGVAVKVMRPDTQDERELAQRFRDEAQFTAQLTSPHIIGVYDYGEHEGLFFLVMELVPGRTVAQLLTERPLTPAEATGIMRDTAEALVVAHGRGVVHRDIKPSNIIVTPQGLAKLGDFGIARSANGTARTRAGEILGTPQYLSPEQAQGQAATPQSDLYALGVVGYEMVTGRKPFDRDTPVATALAHLNEEPPPLPDDVPEPLRGAIEACLAKLPGGRPVSARALIEQLDRSDAAPRPARASGPSVKPLPRSELIAAAGVAFLILVICLAFML